MSLMYCAIGFVTCYIIEAWLIFLFDGKGGVELFNGWCAYLVTAPVLPIAAVTRRIYRWWHNKKQKTKKPTEKER